jgi:hypothetical protein
MPAAGRARIALVAAISCFAQDRSAHTPAFEDYPVKEAFNGVPHAPILVTPEQREYRTRVRDGVEKGWGVRINGESDKQQNTPGPNFAGHYIVIVWGCGSPCLMMAVCDAATGAVYNPPLSARGLALSVLVLPDSVGGNASIAYRRDSRLMIIRAMPPGQPTATSYTFYFVLEDGSWRLLRRVPIAEE